VVKKTFFEKNLRKTQLLEQDNGLLKKVEMLTIKRLSFHKRNRKKIALKPKYLSKHYEFIDKKLYL